MGSKIPQFERVAQKTLAPVRARFVEPMLCAAVPELPQGGSWRYEIKLDGYRALALKSGESARLFSRNGKDLSRRFAAVLGAIGAIPDESLIDGEIVAIDGDGLPISIAYKSSMRPVTH